MSVFEAALSAGIGKRPNQFTQRLTLAARPVETQRVDRMNCCQRMKSSGLQPASTSHARAAQCHPLGQDVTCADCSIGGPDPRHCPDYMSAPSLT
uniref:Uncharacterized protein n=1 Tax=Knipowitschia caucasica TaxID=637954 RepID=A0AAV2IYV0_KNICA